VRLDEWIVAATLVVATGGIADQHNADASLNTWTWEGAGANPRFVLVIGEANWTTIVLGVMGTLREQLEDERVHRTVDAYVNSALKLESNGCPAQYLIDKVAELPDRSLLVMGHCASDAELYGATSTLRGGALEVLHGSPHCNTHSQRVAPFATRATSRAATRKKP